YGSYALAEGADPKTAKVGGADNEVKVDFIYEPPQAGDETRFELLDTDEAAAELERVEALAGMLGVRRVGLVFSHPPREAGFQFSGEEVITAGELQLEAAEGVEDTPFVTVKATVNDEGGTVFDAFQVRRVLGGGAGRWRRFDDDI
ncbi:hypothetical protein TeGR_g14408, partial [Tetraparma gracilis]